MAKVCIKSEKLTPFGEIFAIMEHFNGFFLIGSFDRKIESEEAYTIHLSKKTIFTSPDVHRKHLAKPVSYMIPNSLSCFLLMVGLSFTVLIICFIISASEIAPR